jgi:hypothetical protein
MGCVDCGAIFLVPVRWGLYIAYMFPYTQGIEIALTTEQGT